MKTCEGCCNARASIHSGACRVHARAHVLEDENMLPRWLRANGGLQAAPRGRLANAAIHLIGALQHYKGEKQLTERIFQAFF